MKKIYSNTSTRILGLGVYVYKCLKLFQKNPKHISLLVLHWGEGGVSDFIS